MKLYHGSQKEITNFTDSKSIYFTDDLNVANDYIFLQGNEELGDYGFIYSIEINESEIQFTEDIDQIEKSKNVLFDGNYYKIDNITNYKISEV